MIKMHDDTIVYVLCPAKIVTGGPEAIYQLVDKLRKFGHTAKIITIPPVGNPALLQYMDYDVEFAHAIEDSEKNILITTETLPRKLDEYRFIQKALWWLSVDNHEMQKDKFDFDDPDNKNVVHFVQSAYAHRFLDKKGVKNARYLTDYLNAEYLKRHKTKRKNIVSYTPAKGGEDYVQQLMKADGSIQWLCLERMSRRMHARAMRMSKVYVDFGSHPGKDRQPREAVISGCCVIAGLRGAACLEDDVPIPRQYKFDLQRFDIADIIGAIHGCMTDYALRIHDFDNYARSVRCEERRFESEVESIFGIKRLIRKNRILVKLGNILKFVRQNNLTDLHVIRVMADELLPLPVASFGRRLYYFCRRD